MKRGCIFDLDGTLVDSLTDLALSTNRVLEKHHLPIHDLDKYNHFVGNGVKKLMERALGDEHQDILSECLDDFYVDYEEHCLDYTKAYSGIEELIHILNENNVVLAVVTNKPHFLAVKIVEKIFPGCFVTILGQQDLYPIKPNPQSTLYALMSMKLGCDECFFVGDSDVDMYTAYEANMDSIGVVWGFRGRKELENAGATFVVNHPQEIWEIIKSENK